MAHDFGKIRGVVGVSALSWLLLSGCSLLPGSGNGSSSGEETGVGEAQFAIKIVPNDVRCIQVTAAGSRTITTSFEVTPNQGAQLKMPGLPAGAVTFTANAYAVPCSQVTSTTVAGWSSAPVTAQVVAAGTIQLTLVMMQTGSADIGIEFPGTGGSGSGGGGGSAGTSNAGSGGSLALGVWDSSKWDNAAWQ